MGTRVVFRDHPLYKAIWKDFYPKKIKFFISEVRDNAIDWRQNAETHPLHGYLHIVVTSAKNGSDLLTTSSSNVTLPKDFGGNHTYFCMECHLSLNPSAPWHSHSQVTHSLNKRSCGLIWSELFFGTFGRKKTNVYSQRRKAPMTVLLNLLFIMPWADVNTIPFSILMIFPPF